AAHEVDRDRLVVRRGEGGEPGRRELAERRRDEHARAARLRPEEAVRALGGPLELGAGGAGRVRDERGLVELDPRRARVRELAQQLGVRSEERVEPRERGEALGGTLARLRQGKER